LVKPVPAPDLAQNPSQTPSQTQIIESVKIAVFKVAEDVEAALKTCQITVNTKYRSQKDIVDNIVSIMLDLKSAVSYLDAAKRLLQEG